jgi:DNA-binding IclR family transcriptional regulator
MPRATSKQKADYPTPALEKGLDILELFAAEGGLLTKSEVARRLKRTVSEIFRMLVCLEKRGYISQEPGGERYRLTLQLFHMAQRHPPAERLITEALPLMQAAAHTMNQSCHLGVLEVDRVVILAQVDGPSAQNLSIKAGSTVDLMHAASGHVVLAFLDKERRQLALNLWESRSGNRVPATFIKHLDHIRKTGYEQRASYLVSGVTNISFPVFDETGNTAAALTSPFLDRKEGTSSVRVAVEELRRASEALTIALGGRPAK